VLDTEIKADKQRIIAADGQNHRPCEEHGMQ
jgi:hypothetical protein